MWILCKFWFAATLSAALFSVWDSRRPDIDKLDFINEFHYPCLKNVKGIYFNCGKRSMIEFAT